MSDYPEPIAGAFMFNEKGEVLLVKSPKWYGKYICPGGHIEIGESFEDAVKREVKEETGLEVYDIKPLSVHNCVFSKEFYKKKHIVLLDFTCKAKPGKIVLNDEAEAYIWIKPADALKRNDLEHYTILSIKRIIGQK